MEGYKVLKVYEKNFSKILLTWVEPKVNINSSKTEYYLVRELLPTEINSILFDLNLFFSK